MNPVTQQEKAKDDEPPTIVWFIPTTTGDVHLINSYTLQTMLPNKWWLYLQARSTIFILTFATDSRPNLVQSPDGLIENAKVN